MALLMKVPAPKKAAVAKAIAVSKLHAALEASLAAPSPATAVVEPTIHKVVVTPDAEAISELEAQTVKYIALYRKYVEHDMKETVAQMEKIRKVLAQSANELFADNKPALFTSPEGEIEFSVRSTKTVASDPLKLIEYLFDKYGREAAENVVDISITPLKTMLGGFELAQHTEEVPGSRTLKATRPVKK